MTVINSPIIKQENPEDSSEKSSSEKLEED